MGVSLHEPHLAASLKYDEVGSDGHSGAVCHLPALPERKVTISHSNWPKLALYLRYGAEV